MICRRNKTKKSHWRKRGVFKNTDNVAEPVPILDEDLDMLPIMGDHEVMDMLIKENSYG